MSVDRARTRLEALAAVAPEPWRGQFAAILEELETPEEKRRRYERERKAEQRAKKKPPPDTPVPVGSTNVSRDVPDDIDRPSLSSISPSLSSHASPLSQLSSSERPSQTAKGARASSDDAVGATEMESGVHAVVPPSSPPPLSLVVSQNVPDTARRARAPKQDVGHRLSKDWKPPPELVQWTEGQGVDAAAVFEEFRDHWLARTDARARKADWDATFRNRVRELLRQGKAPTLPDRPAPPSPRGDPAQAKSVLDMLNGNAMPAILAAKETKAHG